MFHAMTTHARRPSSSARVPGWIRRAASLFVVDPLSFFARVAAGLVGVDRAFFIRHRASSSSSLARASRVRRRRRRCDWVRARVPRRTVYPYTDARPSHPIITDMSSSRPRLGVLFSRARDARRRATSSAVVAARASSGQRARAVRYVPLRVVTVRKGGGDEVDAAVDAYAERCRRYAPFDEKYVKSNPKNAREPERQRTRGGAGDGRLSTQKMRRRARRAGTRGRRAKISRI